MYKFIRRVLSDDSALEYQIWQVFVGMDLQQIENGFWQVLFRIGTEKSIGIDTGGRFQKGFFQVIH